ncbi:hypothetical protein XELAEV_18000889mg [Xenopus laevis]|nr:hypothetical protein XELAEV_18000889mg [Xenopus laevis]
MCKCECTQCVCLTERNATKPHPPTVVYETIWVQCTLWVQWVVSCILLPLVCLCVSYISIMLRLCVCVRNGYKWLTADWVSV